MDQRALDQAKLAITYLFRRNGNKPISESALWRAIAFDLKWLNPTQARAFAGALPRTGLVEREADGNLLPTFDTEPVKVPLNFRIAAELVDAMPREGTMLPPPKDGRPAAKPNPARANEPSQPERASPPPTAKPETERVEAAPPDSPDPDDANGPEGAPQSPYGVLLHGLAELTNEPVPAWVERANQTAQATGDVLDPSAALLLAAARRGIDVAPFIEPIRGAYTR